MGELQVVRTLPQAGLGSRKRVRTAGSLPSTHRSAYRNIPKSQRTASRVNGTPSSQRINAFPMLHLLSRPITEPGVEIQFENQGLLLADSAALTVLLSLRRLTLFVAALPSRF